MTANGRGIDPTAIGTEVRLGAIARENGRTKALRYLTSGRVAVLSCSSQAVLARVRGSGHLWTVLYDHGVWTCDCPARGGSCSHLLAVQTVVVVNP